MPPKKKTVQQREEELAQRIMNDVNAGMDARFQRFEQLMERFAPPAPAHPRDAALHPNNKRKNNHTNQDGISDPKVSRLDSDDDLEISFRTPSCDNDFNDDMNPNHTPSHSGHHTRQGTRRHPSECFAEPLHMSTNTAERDLQGTTTSRSHRPVSANTESWAAWATAHPTSMKPRRGFLPTSTHEATLDDSVDSQVKQLLATTVHTLGKGNTQPYDFPYKYILRGPEKVKAAINSVTLPEHLWGIFRIIHDPKTAPDIKPCLMVHIEQIVEDAREFEWELGVRRWSEEVFSRIAERRLTDGWHDYEEIQRMRMVISQSKPFTVRSQQQYQPREGYTKKHPNQSQANQDIMKGGPPCPDYNSTNGCPLNSGHIKNGKRLVHVCSFCLLNTSAANNHPEIFCRNKVRLTGSNNHFQ